MAQEGVKGAKIDDSIRLIRDDVDEAAGDDDDFADGFAVGVALDVLVGLGEVFELFLGGVGGDFHLGADLAVDLHDDFDLVLDEVLSVVCWPGLFG